MTAPFDDAQTTRLEAAPGDPFLGVHVLTEFIYCPRAGLVAFEAQVEDSGDDERPGRLDYLPRYDLQNIEAALQRALQRFALLAGVLVFVGIFTAAVMAAWDWRALWAGAVLLVALSAPTVWTAADVVRLTARRAAALAAVGREPAFGSPDEPAPIDWWQLRSAGFTAKRYEEALYDDGWKLAGMPFLVLCQGDVRIPVFRQHRPQDRLYKQHFARIAAYCHLIERCTGYKCPYGVILFGTSYKGVALRNSPAARKAFHDGLLAARRTIHASRRGSEPRAAPESLCLKCPIGQPVPYRAGITETVSEGGVLPVHGARASDQKLYHSACGDRFRWLPPHEAVRAKGLQRAAR